MKSSYLIIPLCVLLLFPFLGMSQNNIIKINGTVKDEESNAKLGGSSVIIYKNGSQFQTITVAENGKFKVELQLGNTYDIKFSSDAYAPKIARLETRNVPKEEQPGGYEFEMQVSLFKTPENFNLDIMKEPAAKAIYMSDRDEIGWDEAYIIKQREKIDAEFKRLADLNKADSNRKKEFDKIVQQGDEKVIKKSYEEALAKYEEAQKMYPDNQMVKNKIEQVMGFMAGDEAAKKEDAKYALLLVEGDEAMSNRSWDIAQEKFNEAKKMRPKEKAPIEKLAELERRKKENAQFTAYDNLIKEADRLMAEQKYEACINKYKEASNLLSKENYPKEQMAKAKELLEKSKLDAAAIEKKNKKYQELITAGQKNIDKKDYNLALNNYQEASEIKPEETLPKEKIDEINRLMKEQEDALTAEKDRAKQAEADAVKRKEYDRIIKEADKTLADSKNTDLGKLNQSKALYDQALVVLPGESYPKAKNAEIDALISQLKDKMSADQLAKQQAEEERLRKEAEWKQAQREQEEKALAEKRRREEEEEARKKQKNDNLANNNRPKDRNSKSGTSAEDALDKFYREARIQRAQLIADSVAKVKKSFDESGNAFSQQNKERIDRDREIIDTLIKSSNDINNQGSNWRDKRVNEHLTETHDFLDNDARYQKRNEGRIAKDKEQMANQKTETTNISSEGAAWRERRVADQRAEEEEIEMTNKDLVIHANEKRNIRLKEMEDLKKAQANLQINDDFRKAEKVKMDRAIEEDKAFHNTAETQSEARRAGDKRTFELQDQLSKNIQKNGDELHSENVNDYRENLQDYTATDLNYRDAAKSRADVENIEIQDEKTNFLQSRDQRSEERNRDYTEINDQKYSTQLSLNEKRNEASERSYEERQELLKKQDEIKKPQTRPEITRSILQNESAITERSYDLGNKKVLERTVIVDGKTFTYKKIVSTTGVYYFKNGISITEQTWRDETTKLMEQ
jgi:hypothetical protein